MNDGGPAFPVPPVGTGDPRDGMTTGSSSLSTLAYFAGNALQGLLAHSGNSMDSKYSAMAAVEHAESLLKELERRRS